MTDWIALTLSSHSSQSPKSSEYHKSVPRWCWTELAASYWTQWRGALCHILHTRRWHRTVNWHWEQPDPLQLDRTWQEQSVHQHLSAGCKRSWEIREEHSNGTVQPHTTRWALCMNTCTHGWMLSKILRLKFTFSTNESCSLFVSTVIATNPWCPLFEKPLLQTQILLFQCHSQTKQVRVIPPTHSFGHTDC